AEGGIERGRVSCAGAEQAVTAFAPKLEGARPGDRPALIDALLAVIAYHRVGDRPGRWEPRARKRRREPGAYLHEPRAVTKQAKDRSKWFEASPCLGRVVASPCGTQGGFLILHHITALPPPAVPAGPRRTPPRAL